MNDLKVGELVDDHLRPSGEHGGADAVCVERVGDDRTRAQLAHLRGAVGAARHCRHLVSGLDESRQAGGGR